MDRRWPQYRRVVALTQVALMMLRWRLTLTKRTIAWASRKRHRAVTKTPILVMMTMTKGKRASLVLHLEAMRCPAKMTMMKMTKMNQMLNHLKRLLREVRPTILHRRAKSMTDGRPIHNPTTNSTIGLVRRVMTAEEWKATDLARKKVAKKSQIWKPTAMMTTTKRVTRMMMMTKRMMTRTKMMTTIQTMTPTTLRKMRTMKALTV
mmetsp:Transcript_28111/g.78839  ORF Transcript_28111/g.78839 Transcript_28111/m.78839 type:complete len:206 (+) Transcript_28111:2-619(+)